MSNVVISIPSGAISREELGRVMKEYLALEQARVFRGLLVTRFGLLALATIVVSLSVPGLPATACWVVLVLFVTPPVWAWIVELRLESSLARRLDGVNGVSTREISSTFELDDC